MNRIIEKRKFMLELKMGILRYALVNAFWVLINWTRTPHNPWVLWVLIERPATRMALPVLFSLIIFNSIHF
jgi:hypothetical protein